MSPALKAKRGRFGPGGTAPVIESLVAPASAATTVATGGYTVSVTDAVDGDISATATWTSDLDGLLGSGASPTLTLTTVGTHVITVEATAPTGGQTVSDTVTVECTP